MYLSLRIYVVARSCRSHSGSSALDEFFACGRCPAGRHLCTEESMGDAYSTVDWDSDEEQQVPLGEYDVGEYDVPMARCDSDEENQVSPGEFDGSSQSGDDYPDWEKLVEDGDGPCAEELEASVGECSVSGESESDDAFDTMAVECSTRQACDLMVVHCAPYPSDEVKSLCPRSLAWMP